MSSRVCGVGCCDREHYARDLCKAHYQRWRRGERGSDLHSPIREWGRDTCKVESCDREHEALGYCDAHYQRWRSGDRGGVLRRHLPDEWPRTCCVQGCDRKHDAHSLCYIHRHRLLEAGEVGQQLRRPIERHKPATQTPTTADLAWAAGFLEGEGSFLYQGTAVVKTCQKQKQPLHKLKSLFGGNIWVDHKNQGRSSEWSVHGKRARGVALTLYGLLSDRRQWQVRKMLRGDGVSV